MDNGSPGQSEPANVFRFPSYAFSLVMTFPDPQTYLFPEWVLFEDYFYYAKDVISFGDPLTQENLRDAYRKGIFPWHMEGVPLPWYCPERRAILRFQDLHVSRSLEKERRKNKLRCTIDEDFNSVITECAKAPREGQKGTWITKEFINAFTELHESGMAHSVEAWDAAGNLAGGLYGVDAGGVFCGESMFFKEPNASKLALLFLIDYLKKRGSMWIDVQVMTPHMRALGAREISRRDFVRRLKETQGFELNLFGPKANRAP